VRLPERLWDAVIEAHGPADWPTSVSHGMARPSGGGYAGLDRFGRVLDQKWQTTAATPTVLDEYTYTYDRDSNRLTRGNSTQTSLARRTLMTISAA